MLLFPLFAKAHNKAEFAFYPFLEQGFDMAQYQKCTSLIEKCPSNGPFPDEACTKRIMHASRVCKQLEKLTQVLLFTPIVKQVKGFTLLDLFSIGDGQHAYYILSHGKLIDTTFDPRHIDKALAKQYKKA